MATETGREVQTDTAPTNWKVGVVVGVAGGLAMGILMLIMNEAVVAVAIPSSYFPAPPPTAPVGMAVHVFHGGVLGLVFAGIVGTLGLDTPGKVLGSGLAWGVVIWLTLAALLMPIWLGFVDSPASPPFPNFAPPSLFWHVVYGLVLGGVYLAVEDRL